MRPLRALFSSPAAEKILHQRAALVFQHAFSHIDAMIQKVRVADLEATMDRAGAFVSRAVNQPAYPRLNQRARAHRTRLDRRVDRNAPQSVDRKSTRLNSSHMSISYAVFCLKKKKKEQK